MSLGAPFHGPTPGYEATFQVERGVDVSAQFYSSPAQQAQQLALGQQLRAQMQMQAIPYPYSTTGTATVTEYPGPELPTPSDEPPRDWLRRRVREITALAPRV